jgi:hypothetical protein
MLCASRLTARQALQYPAVAGSLPAGFNQSLNRIRFPIPPAAIRVATMK